MGHALHRSGLGIAVVLTVALVFAAGPPIGALSQVGAQAFPAIRPAGLFTFPGDWSRIRPTTITVFYPAQASWQHITSQAHPGGNEVLAGMTCRTCHTGTEKTLGDRLVRPSRIEPDPVDGKRGWVEVSVRAAFDDVHLYLRLEWAAPQPGASHTLWRFDGTRWVAWGGPKPAATRAGRPPSYEDRLALMLTERDVPAFDDARTGFNQAGCWIACHNSLRNMPNDVAGERVTRHPYFGTAGLRVSDMRHYLLISRTVTDETGGWDRVKTPAELEQLKAEGSFLDLWQWRAYQSSPVGYAGDDFVLEFRNSDAGRSPFSTPGTPSFMYNQARTGFRAVPEARFNELLVQLPLIEEQTAVRLDPTARFAAGDILPQNVLRIPQGSGADIMANGAWGNGRWVVELRRRLVTANPDDKPLRPGRVVRFGLALFDDKVSNRYHHVSFEHTLGLGEGTIADVRAVRIRP